MFSCPRCNTRYDDPPAYCGVCGTKLTGKEAVTTPLADPLVGMVVDGRYRIIDLIGRGGMGAVYRVEHVKMGKIMAMKLLHGELSQDSDLSRRFKREAETVSRLSHINTVSVFDFGSHNTMMYLVMEYIDGLDLAELIRAQGQIPFLRAANILTQVCSALCEAHSKGIIHRDLKPENIKIGKTDDGGDFVKVLDFGLAQLRNMGDKTRITVKGSLVGTPYYMAPEHIRSEPVDQRTDIYALGAVMYKMLTGETPFSANTPMGVISKHLIEVPEAPSKRFKNIGIPEQADEIVLRAISKDPRDRYQSAEEMRAALIQAIESMTSNAAPGYKGAGFDANSQIVHTKAETTAEWKSKSITIGAREVEIGTKSDFIQFEKQLKQKRIISMSLGILLLAGAAIAAIVIALNKHFEDSNPTRETEPNDDSSNANTMKPGIPLTGYIAGNNQRGDIDWYRLFGFDSSATAFEVEIIGVPGLDLALQLVDPVANEQLATANRKGQGGSEIIGPTTVNRRDVYLIVQEVRSPGIPPGNFDKTPYRLTYNTISPSMAENEPNNTIASATPALPGMMLSGYLGADDPIDVYCVSAGAAVKTIQVSGISDLDMGLILRLGPQGTPLTIDNAPVSQGEGVAIPSGPGPTCVQVEAKQVDGYQGLGLYKILFK